MSFRWSPLPSRHRATRGVFALLAFVSLVPGACSNDESSAHPNGSDSVALVDDFGAPVPVDTAVAARVVSLNPTATEIIYALGQAHRLVGRSNWDEFPAEVVTVPAVGNGIRPNIEAILAVRPTLVVMYASDENRAAADALARAGVRTLTIRVDRIAEFREFTHMLGRVLNAETEARQVVDSVTRTLDAVRSAVATAPRPTVVWPLWRSPVMVVGTGSYLDELIQIAGARNVFDDQPAPSPQVSIEEIARRNPDLVLVGDVGYRELRGEPVWRVVPAVRADDRMRKVDTRLTGRPAVNLGMAAVSLARVIHPELAGKLP